MKPKVEIETESWSWNLLLKEKADIKSYISQSQKPRPAKTSSYTTFTTQTIPSAPEQKHIAPYWALACQR